ncbi:MAG: carbamoyltransferase [Lachnospiraceae bacterium]|nr:carbamoyltransferase [Lachnospiraceae bacterium]
MSVYVLGISALYHDSAAALVKDGEIIAAAQEERFTRVKHDFSMPSHAIKFCMEQGKISGGDLTAVVYYDNPILTLERFLKNLQFAGADSEDLFQFSYESLFQKKMWIHKLIEKEFDGESIEDKIYITEHHISHASSAFFPSPFKRAAIITIDGVGEWATTTVGYGCDNNIHLYREIDYPHSLGMLYSAFTYFCGFKVNSGDYKLMGLAPYGTPVYYSLIKEHLIDVKPDGSYCLNMDYFDYQYGRCMTNDKFAELFGGERRIPESKITKREMDMAASVQKVIEEVVILIARTAKKLVGDDVDSLVMAGGVALNCVANGVLVREKIFKNIWIQPAAGDAGGALGAALYYYYQYCGQNRYVDGGVDKQKGSYLGPEFSEDFMKGYCDQRGYRYHLFSQSKDLYDKIAQLIDEGKVIGLFEGRMEYGPRALGNRSIIGDARSAQMQSKLNLKIKYRESFRPFAPSVLEEDVEKYFALDVQSPYMLVCADVKDDLKIPFDLNEEMVKTNQDMLPVVNITRSSIPAVTHIDYSARIQTVSEENNPVYYGILKAFKERTGCSVIINTSFNVRGEPIVCTPEDAYLCFMRTEMDVLVLGNLILIKDEQPLFQEKEDWRKLYALD